MKIRLTVHNLTLSYDRHPILDRLEFTIPPGRRVALLGANGAGKTTLLRCLSRALKPATGTVFLNRQDIESLSPRNLARLMAVVPQETRADFDFTVEETVLMGRLPYLRRFTAESDEEKSIARRAMARTGITHLAKRSITTLSGGEKQRVIIARALCQEPRILLLDEPTANLDLGYQHSLLELITGLNVGQGMTIIAAIHDLNLAARFFDHLILLAGGRILAAGTAEEVMTPPLIKKAYGVAVLVYRHPLTGGLQVSVKEEHRSSEKRKPAIHVIGGGEEALPILEYLRTRGFPLSIGPVTPEDSSYRFAVFYDLPVIEVPPFSPISDEAHRAHRELIKKAALTVIPPIPFGTGNLRNLKAVEKAHKQGAAVAILRPPAEKWADFSGGQAERLLRQLAADGAQVVTGKEEIALLLESRDKGSPIPSLKACEQTGDMMPAPGAVPLDE